MYNRHRTGDTSLGKDAVSVSEASAEGWNSLDSEELDTEDIILDLSMALGLKGRMPDFANPALMLGIEKARSKGSLTT